MRSLIGVDHIRFPDAIRFYMKEKSLSIRELSEKSECPVHIITHVLERRFDGIPYTLPIVLGIGLGLSPEEIYDLLSRACRTIPTFTDPYDLLLREIISRPYPKTMAECNALLTGSGFDALTDFGITVPERLNKY